VVVGVTDYCRRCHQPINAGSGRVYAIRGYEETRAGGGQNHVLEKERLDGWVWHRHCWDIAMRKRKGHGVQLELRP
jgi:hypothetical protein